MCLLWTEMSCWARQRSDLRQQNSSFALRCLLVCYWPLAKTLLNRERDSPSTVASSSSSEDASSRLDEAQVRGEGGRPPRGRRGRRPRAAADRRFARKGARSHNVLEVQAREPGAGQQQVW